MKIELNFVYIIEINKLHKSYPMNPYVDHYEVNIAYHENNIKNIYNYMILARKYKGQIIMKVIKL